ncbi:hypothetical protein IAR50_007435 [Cryptococcus sp. DSM 104548]
MNYIVKRPCSGEGCDGKAIGVIFYCPTCDAPWCQEHLFTLPHICRVLEVGLVKPVETAEIDYPAYSKGASEAIKSYGLSTRLNPGRDWRLPIE